MRVRGDQSFGLAAVVGTECNRIETYVCRLSASTYRRTPPRCASSERIAAFNPPTLRPPPSAALRELRTNRRLQLTQRLRATFVGGQQLRDDVLGHVGPERRPRNL